MKLLAAGALLTTLSVAAFYLVMDQTAHAAHTTCEAPASTIATQTWEPWFENAEDVPVRHVPIPNFTAGGDEQVSNLEQHRLYVDQRGPLVDLNDVDWANENHGNYYSTQLHGLVGIGAAIRGNEELPNPVEEVIGDHIINWALCAGKNREINSRSWYEGTVIKRLSNLLRALIYIDHWGSLGELTRSDLLYLVEAHASYLMDEPGIYAFGNHGIRQDMLLATTALALPSLPRSAEMLELAERRLNEAAEALFTEEGIWMEHAPGYVNYALRLIDEVDQLAETSRRFDPEPILANYDTSLEYLLSSLLPDARIPYIGVSNADHVSSAGTRDADLEAELSARENTLHAYPDYGHAIVRGEHPNGLYLLFVASQNLPAGKRHSDELSFLLYNFGRAWITEGGHSASDVAGMRRYLRTPFAHNTYILNGEAVRELGEPELNVNLVNAARVGSDVTLYGKSERFASEAHFDRTVYVENYQTVSIRDELEGDGEWEGRLHFPGDLEISVENSVVTARSPEGREMILTFQSGAELDFDTCRGEKDPICGWGNADHDFGPATTLTWAFEGDALVEIEIAWTSQ